MLDCKKMPGLCKQLDENPLWALDFIPGGGIVVGGVKTGVPLLVRILGRLLGKEATALAIRLTERGIQHSFARHAAQWFGGQVTRGTHMAAWKAVLERGAKSTQLYLSRLGETETVAQLARLEGKHIVLHYEKATGNFLSAFVPNQAQLTAAYKALGIIKP